MVTINLYTTPTCMPCKILKKKLENLVNKNLTINAFNALDFPELGIMATPHAIVDKDNNILFSGHVSSISSFIELIQRELKEN